MSKEISIAKRKPTLTLLGIKKKLEYKINPLTYPNEAIKRFYSNLRPIPNSAYKRTKKEYKKFIRNYYSRHESVIKENFPGFSKNKVSITIYNNF